MTKFFIYQINLSTFVVNLTYGFSSDETKKYGQLKASKANCQKGKRFVKCNFEIEILNYDDDMTTNFELIYVCIGKRAIVSNSACLLCHSEEDDDKQFGPFYTTNKFRCHYYCLLFASGLVCNGDENEGIKGFLLSDIEKEARRASKLVKRLLSLTA